MQRITGVAVVILVLDAIFLGAVGIRADRPVLVVGALLALGFAALMIVLYQRYQRQRQEVTAARHALKADVEAMAESLKRSREA